MTPITHTALFIAVAPPQRTHETRKETTKGACTYHVRNSDVEGGGVHEKQTNGTMSADICF